jgi:hypothetical protein
VTTFLPFWSFFCNYLLKNSLFLFGKGGAFSAGGLLFKTVEKTGFHKKGKKISPVLVLEDQCQVTIEEDRLVFRPVSVES